MAEPAWDQGTYGMEKFQVTNPYYIQVPINFSVTNDALLAHFTKEYLLFGIKDILRWNEIICRNISMLTKPSYSDKISMQQVT